MITVQLDKFKLYKFSYASTLHSIQGLNKKDKLTIFNCDIQHVTRRFVWNAVTSVRNLDQITFKLSSQKELEILNASLVKRYQNNKIDNYIQQDKMKGIEFDKIIK